MITGTDTRFRYLEKKVGMFVLVAMLGLIGVIVFIVIEKDLFTATYTVRLTSPKGTGFSQGMPIKLSGFRIGRVKSITLNDSAAVDVVLQIDRKYRKWIRKDSEARLIKEGLIGDYVIEITSGSSDELIPENGKIAFGNSKTLDELAEDIAAKVTPVLMDIRDIISYVTNENGDVKNTLRNLRIFLGNIDGTLGKADRLLIAGTNTIEKAGNSFDLLMDRTENRMAMTEPILGKIDNTLTNVEKNMPGILDKIDVTMSNLETLSFDLKAFSSETVPQVPKLVSKSEAILDKGDGVLEGLKWIWPFSSVLVQEKEKSLLQGDSYE